MAPKQPERRQPPWWTPIVMMCIAIIMMGMASCSFIAGPVIAVVGFYAKSAVMEQRLGSIEEKVDTVVKQNIARERVDGRVDQKLLEHDRQIAETKQLAEQAMARATNAQIDAKSVVKER